MLQAELCHTDALHPLHHKLKLEFWHNNNHDLIKSFAPTPWHTNGYITFLQPYYKDNRFIITWILHQIFMYSVKVMLTKITIPLINSLYLLPSYELTNK